MKFLGPSTLALALAAFGAPAYADTFSQAPSLAEEVSAGTLPPVAERLPTNPEVIAPVDEVGQYGGTLRRGLVGGNDHNNILRLMGPQGLTRWDPTFSRAVPNLAESFEALDGGAAWQFTLREGLKWSDGDPMDADDLVFAADMLNDPAMFPELPRAYQVGDGSMSIERVDDRTVIYRFSAPFGTFPEVLASPLGQYPTYWAAHYCGQFQPDGGGDLDAMTAEAGVETWPDLMRLRCGDLEVPARWGNPDRPTMDPWIVDEPYTGSATLVTLERNPYFWQVDSEGNQLPYIDELAFQVYQDQQSLLVATLAGNIDMQIRHLNAVANRPVLAEGAEAGGYQLLPVSQTFANAMGIMPNLTHLEDGKRAILGDPRFRQAMSLGIDRDAIIDIVLLGQSVPYQIGPLPGHVAHNEQLATQFLDYDPDAAAALLDEAGYTDGDGVREAADGTPLSFTIDVVNSRQEWIDMIELMGESLDEIGIRIRPNVIERSLFTERGQAGLHDIQVWDMPGGLDPIVDFRPITPAHPIVSAFGPQWRIWNASGGTQGEEPPASLARRMELANTYRQTASPDDRAEIAREAMAIAAEGFEAMGIATAPPTFAIVSNRMRNVPANMPLSWTYPTPSPTLPQQYFIAE
ncbi:MAG: ABC transporter substrate-binding protein [Hyphomicrobiales bacterium]